MKHFSTWPEYSPSPALIESEELDSWVLQNDDDLLVIDKPGWVVCHPSKAGPWSSLVGACREHFGIETLHLVSRLDRETSGVVLLAKHKASARRYQMAIQERKVEKRYLTILHGELKEEQNVKKHLAKDIESEVASKVAVRRSNSSKSAETVFKPLATGNGFTFAEVIPVTGRKHQIRAHALWMGHPVVGDKLYGQADDVFLEFIEKGWTDRMSDLMPMRRQALQCQRLTFDEGPVFEAPVAWDMAQFCEERMGVSVPIDS